MGRVLMIFVDGLGLGEEEEFNPLVSIPTPGLRSYLEGAPLTRKRAGLEGRASLLLPLDASLGVPGAPQSATGQASLFTGENAAALLGHHLKGFPNQALLNLLQEKGILGRLKGLGLNVTFANAFRPLFFERLSRGIRHFSCTTAANYFAGLPFRTLEDVEAGRALYADITNDYVRAQGYPVTLITPGEAASRLAKLAAAHDFTLFEYFFTDLAAHSGDFAKVRKALTRLDRFLGALPALLPSDSLLVVTSDHGNIEDLRSKEHTGNPVPLLAWGRDRRCLEGLSCITEVSPALTDYLLAVKRQGRQGFVQN